MNGYSVINANDINASRLVDRDNTGYYCDPAGTSNLNSLTVGGSNVLTASTGFGATGTSDATVSGTYNALDIQLKSGVVGSTEIADGSVASIDVAFNYAGSTTKGGAASDVACGDCVALGTETSGTLPINEGGTGATTADSARINLVASGTGNCPSGQVVQNLTTGTPQCITPTITETDPQVGTATSGRVCYGIAGNVVECNDNIIWDTANDRLGIGTTNPSHALNVVGGLNVTSGSFLSGSTNMYGNLLMNGYNIVNVNQINNIAVSSFLTTTASFGQNAASDVSGTYDNLQIKSGAVGSTEVADNSLAATDLAVNVVSSLDGVTNDGGNIDLVAGSGIAITPDDANNQITIASTASGIGGSGTLGYIPMWNSSSSLNNSVIYQTAGNVGIGTNSPKNKLDVVGDVNVTGKIVTSYVNSPLIDKGSGLSEVNRTADINRDGFTNWDDLSLMTMPGVYGCLNTSPCWNKRIGIDNLGNYIYAKDLDIGGTGGPDGRIDGKDSAELAKYYEPTTGFAASVQAQNYAAFFYADDGSEYQLPVVTIRNSDVSSNESHGLLIQAGNTNADLPLYITSRSGAEILRVRGDGNVGIGNAAPAYKLDVNNSVSGGETAIRVLNNVDAANTKSSLLLHTGGGWNGAVSMINEFGGGRLEFSVPSGGKFSFVNGNVGIGIASPQDELEVAGNISFSDSIKVTDNLGYIRTALSPTGTIRFQSTNSVTGPYITNMYLNAGRITLDYAIIKAIDGDGGASYPPYSFSADTDTGIYRPSDNSTGFATGGVERMRIDSNGNVGIGTMYPSQKLEVNGGIMLNTTTSKPTCSATTRGTLWFTQSASGVKDMLEVCAKDAANTYAWRTIY
jgi:hypothetical protein